MVLCAFFSNAARISSVTGLGQTLLRQLRQFEPAVSAQPLGIFRKRGGIISLPHLSGRTGALSTAYARLSRRKHKRRIGRRGIELRLLTGQKARVRECLRHSVKRCARSIVLPVEMAEDELLRAVFRKKHRERSALSFDRCPWSDAMRRLR